MSNPGYENLAQGLHQTQMPGQQGQPMQQPGMQQGMQQPGMQPMQGSMPPGFQQVRPVQAGQGYGQGYPGMQMPAQQTQAARFQPYQPPQSAGLGSTQQFIQKIAQDKAAQAAQQAPQSDPWLDASRNG